MGIVRRQIHCRITIGGEQVEEFFAVQIKNSLESPVAQATIIVPKPYGEYNDEVIIQGGATPGDGAVTRFRGLRRNIHFDLWPRAVTIDCFGELQKAADYFNFEDPLRRDWNAPGRPIDADVENDSDVGQFGGLFPQDLCGGQPANAKDIIIAVLNKANVRFNPENIVCTGRIYGNWLNPAFIWKAGTVSFAEIYSGQVFGFRQAGESALSYIQRYNQIEAEWDGAQVGGFYRIVESLAGEVYVVRVGGRPRNRVTYDWITGEDIVFVEGWNILSARTERQFPIANRVLVVGRDTGAGFNWHYEARGSNDVMPDNSYHYDPNPPSSPMIDFADRARATDYGFGMDCETVAHVRLLEVNRETVVASVETAEDFYIGPAQTHIIQAATEPADQNVSGTVDRLGTGEKLWVQGVEFRIEMGQNGAPVLTQSIDYLGGGAPDEFDEIPGD